MTTEPFHVFERSAGNTVFGCVVADDADPVLVAAAVPVWVELRSLFPSVRPEQLTFGAAQDKGVVAYALQYPLLYPMLRSAPLSARTPEDCLATFTGPQRRGAYNEWSSSEGVRDFRSAGVLALGPDLVSAAGYEELLAYWVARDRRLVARGFPVRMHRWGVSPFEFTLMHEFGHLVAGVLEAEGWRTVEPLYAELSRVVFGVKPSVTQWRYHLVNYPSRYRVAAGPYAGPAARRAANRKALKATIGFELGRYAGHNRDELFAEAFALAFGGDDLMRRRLRTFRQLTVKACTSATPTRLAA